MPIAARIHTEINVPLSAINKNIIRNSRRKLPWLGLEKLFRGEVAIIAGAPSIKDKLDDIRQMQQNGCMIMSLNGTHDYLVENGIIPDFFCMLDARPINKFAAKPQKDCIYLLASQVHPKFFDKLKDYPVILWHCEHQEFPRNEINDICRKNNLFSWPSISAKKTVGLTSILVCKTLGFDDIYLFGYDSSFADYQHAYTQKQNEKDDIVDAYVGNKKFKSTPTLVNQAQMYLHVKGAVEMTGARVHMCSEGLIAAMHDAKEHMTIEQREAVKYLDIWDINEYRVHSPGLAVVPKAMQLMRPEEGSKIVDFGIGSGKAAWAFKLAGYDILGVDIAANCLDADKLMPLCISPLWDIPDSVRGDYGYCTDVMEHIPTEKVNDVLRNIAKSIDKKVFFQIDLHEDAFGQAIGDILHLTVKPLEWWREELEKVFVIEHLEDNKQSLIAIVSKKETK